MKNIILFLLFVLPILGCAQYPGTGNKQRLGWQTTGDGLVYRDAGYPSYTPNSRNNAYVYMDTVAKRYYHFSNGAWYDLSDEKYIHRQDQSVLALAVRDSLTTYDRLFIAMEITSGGASDRGVQLPVTALDSTYAGRVVRVSSLDSSGTYNVFVSSSSPDGLLIDGALATTYYLEDGETVEFQLYVFDGLYQWRLVHTNVIDVLGSFSATTPLQYNNTTGVFSILQSGAAQDGYLSSTDWNTFNNKPGGTGTAGTLTKWATTTTLGDAAITETATRLATSLPFRLANIATVSLPASPLAGDQLYNPTTGHEWIYGASAWLQGTLPTGTVHYTLRYDGTVWAASSFLQTTTTAVNINSPSAVETLNMKGGVYFQSTGAGNPVMFRIRGSDGQISVGSNSSGFNVGNGFAATDVAGSIFYHTAPSTWDNAGKLGYGVAIPMRTQTASTAVNHYALAIGDISNGYEPTSGTIQRTAFYIFNRINQTGTASGVTRGAWINPNVTSAPDYRALQISSSNVMPVPGTQIWTGIRIDPSLNQTGTGITRGVYVVPDITAVADWRSLSTANNSGRALSLEGTASIYINPAAVTQDDTVSRFIVLNPTTGFVGYRASSSVSNWFTTNNSYTGNRTHNAATYTTTIQNSSGWTLEGTGTNVYRNTSGGNTINIMRNTGANIVSGNNLLVLNVGGLVSGSESTVARWTVSSLGDGTTRYGDMSFAVASASTFGGQQITMYSSASIAEKRTVIGYTTNNYPTIYTPTAITTISGRDGFDILSLDSLGNRKFAVKEDGTIEATAYGVGSKLIAGDSLAYLVGFTPSGRVGEVDATGLGSDGNGIYSGSGLVPANTRANVTDSLKFIHARAGNLDSIKNYVHVGRDSVSIRVDGDIDDDDGGTGFKDVGTFLKLENNSFELGGWVFDDQGNTSGGFANPSIFMDMACIYCAEGNYPTLVITSDKQAVDDAQDFSAMFIEKDNIVLHASQLDLAGNYNTVLSFFASGVGIATQSTGDKISSNYINSKAGLSDARIDILADTAKSTIRFSDGVGELLENVSTNRLWRFYDKYNLPNATPIATSGVKSTFNFTGNATNTDPSFTVPTFFTQTADATVSNTTTETSLTSTGVGTKTIPVNYFQAGQTYVVRARGYFSTNGTTPNLTFDVEVGGVDVATTTAFAVQDMGGLDETWELQFEFTVRTTGGSGTAIGQGDFKYCPVHLNCRTVDLLNTSAFTLDTTIGNSVDLTAEWGTASTNNYIVCTNFSIEAKN